MDMAEYRRMFTNLIGSLRIDVAILVKYAERRNINITDIQEKGEYTITTL